MANTETKQFDTGAVRSKDADDVRFDLITPIGLRRLAETYNEGAKKYGAYNWLKGFPASDLMNHTIAHCYKWLNGDTSEDHLAHAAWGLFTIMHFQETRPELMDIPAVQQLQESKLLVVYSVHRVRIELTNKEQVLDWQKESTVYKGIYLKLNIPVDGYEPGFGFILDEYHANSFKKWYGVNEILPESKTTNGPSNIELAS